jgi:hypothetical protein
MTLQYARANFISAPIWFFFSFFFFFFLKNIGRAFPVWIGIGSGLGASYSDCQRTFNPVHLPGYRFLDSPPTSENKTSSPASAAAACDLPPQKHAQNKTERLL